MTPRGVYERPRKPLRERFWSKVDRRGEDECWPWLGATNGVGYGQIMTAAHNGEDEIVGAHRVALFLATGNWPTQDTRHLCNNRICVNARHLAPGSRGENMADMIRSGRSLVGELQPRHKLNWEQVREARRRHSEGVDVRQLAADYDVSVRTMGQLISGETWKEPG